MLRFNNGGYAAPPPPPMQQRPSARDVPRERVLQPWEREVLERADVKRKATVAQIYFLDYYCELSYPQAEDQAKADSVVDLLG
jgi:hypothetical protein